MEKANIKKKATPICQRQIDDDGAMRDTETFRGRQHVKNSFLMEHLPGCQIKFHILRLNLLHFLESIVCLLILSLLNVLQCLVPATACSVVCAQDAFNTCIVARG